MPKRMAVFLFILAALVVAVIFGWTTIRRGFSGQPLTRGNLYRDDGSQPIHPGVGTRGKESICGHIRGSERSA
jgi:hypothetical protein